MPNLHYVKKNIIHRIHVRNKMAIGKKKWYRCWVSVCDRCSDSIKKISLQLLLLDEEACRSRTFQSSRVGWILSSLNKNQAVACAQKSKEKETSRLRWPDKNGEQKIALHPAYLAAIYSKEDSPRVVFHHAGV